MTIRTSPTTKMWRKKKKKKIKSKKNRKKIEFLVHFTIFSKRILHTTNPASSSCAKVVIKREEPHQLSHCTAINRLKNYFVHFHIQGVGIRRHLPKSLKSEEKKLKKLKLKLKLKKKLKEVERKKGREKEITPIGKSSQETWRKLKGGKMKETREDERRKTSECSVEVFDFFFGLSL